MHVLTKNPTNIIIQFQKKKKKSKINLLFFFSPVPLSPAPITFLLILGHAQQQQMVVELSTVEEHFSQQKEQEKCCSAHHWEDIQYLPLNDNFRNLVLVFLYLKLRRPFCVVRQHCSVNKLTCNEQPQLLHEPIQLKNGKHLVEEDKTMEMLFAKPVYKSCQGDTFKLLYLFFLIWLFVS